MARRGDALWVQPSLEEAFLHQTTLPGVPAEVLSQNYGDNCLPRLRAWLRDRAASGAASVTEVKLLILGNGHAGKTQLARRLRGQGFDPAEPSTHGIRVSTATLPGGTGQPDTPLSLWDFGGQDIYHGAHALFVRSRAVFLLAWSMDTDPARTPHVEANGLRFENQPLAYWLDYVRHVGDGSAPVVLAQTKRDRDGDRPPPVEAGRLAGDGFLRQVHTSASDLDGLDELLPALRRAVAALRASQTVAEIPASWDRVRRRVLAPRRPDGTWPARHRTLDRATFDAWCAGAGIADAGIVLGYLHNAGAVFYRDGLFNDRIVRDQQWALDAVYAVFDRDRALPVLRATGGWVTRPMLAPLIWPDFSPRDQFQFLAMMESCGICFVHTRDHDDPDRTRYMVPELLPDRAAIAAELASRWDAAAPAETRSFRYRFLHRGLLRALMARLGEQAGSAGTYWRGGMFLYDAGTGARAILEEAITGGWRGAIHLRAQGPAASVLLDRLAERVRRESQTLGLTPEAEEPPPATPPRPGPDRAAAAEPPIRPAVEPAAHRSYGVSYGWNDADGGGPDREAPVRALLAEAKRRTIVLLHDKTHMTFGDRITAFIRQLVQVERLIVILSEKYLRSAYCMTELSLISRQCVTDHAFARRVRVFCFRDARFGTASDRSAHGRYWREQARARKQDAADSVLAVGDYEEWQRMQTWAQEVPNILFAVQDTLHPRSLADPLDSQAVADLLRYAFGD